MPELRVRGQETQVRITQAGVLLSTITAIKSSNFAFVNRILTDQYLSETAQRKDMIFENIRGQILIHPEDQEVFTLIQFLIDRAQRRVAVTAQVNIASRLSFPNGQRPRINVFDAQFGELNLNIAGRDAYVDLTLPFEASRAEIIQTP